MLPTFTVTDQHHSHLDTLTLIIVLLQVLLTIEVMIYSEQFASSLIIKVIIVMNNKNKLVLIMNNIHKGCNVHANML